jgi:orotate phosphoribosyltransferase
MAHGTDDSFDPAAAEAETLEIFRRSGALLTDDHFVYVDGGHGAGWIAKDLLYPDTKEPQRLGELLAGLVRARDLAPEIVCGPATGGLIMTQWLGRALDASAVFAEHDPTWMLRDHGPGSGDEELAAPFVLRRGYDRAVAGRRVLACDDIVNSGHSLEQTIAVLRASGADVVGAATWITRGNVTVDSLDVAPFLYLAEVDIPEWPATSCQLCATGVPINVEYAHGREYVEELAGEGSSSSS